MSSTDKSYLGMLRDGVAATGRGLMWAASPITSTYYSYAGPTAPHRPLPAPQPLPSAPQEKPTWTARALGKGAKTLGGYIPQALPILQAIKEGAEEAKKRSDELAAAQALERQYCKNCRIELIPEKKEEVLEEQFEDNLNIPSLLKTFLSHLESDYAWLVPSFIVSSFAIMMRDFVVNVNAAIQHELHCGEIKHQFAKIAEELEQFLANHREQEDEGVQELTALLRRILHILQDNPHLHVYTNGIRLPDLAIAETSVSSEELDDLLQKNISGLKEEMPVEALSLTEKKEQLDQERDRFIQNTTHFLTTKIFHETICRLSLPNTLYFDIARKARGDNPNATLKAEINQSLREQEVNIFLRGIVYLTYPLLSYLLNYFIQRLISTCYEEIDAYIGEITATPDDTARFQNAILTRLTDFLSIDQGVYRTIASPKTVMTGSIQKMRCDLLDSQESNQGYTSRELYTVCTEILIERCTGNFFLSWLFRNIIGNKDTIVEALINNGVGSLVDAQGYTHALNTLLVQQLEEALSKLRRSSDSDSELPDFSETKREELLIFVKNLFEDLKLNRAADTLPELQAALKPNTLTEVVDNMITEEVIASITHNLASLISSMISREKLVDLALQFTQTINKIYDEPGEALDEEEAKHTEARVSLLMERLVNLSVTRAIQEKIEFGPIREQQETNRRILQLQQEAQFFSTQISSRLKAAGIEEPPFTAEQTLLLQSISQETKHHIIRLTQQLSEIRMLPIPEQSRIHLENLYLEITKQLTPYRRALKHLKQYHSHALQLQSLKSFLEQFRENHRQLADLANHSAEEIETEVLDYQRQLLLSQAHLPLIGRTLTSMASILSPEYKGAVDILIEAPPLPIAPMQNALTQLRFAKAQEEENGPIHFIHQTRKQVLEQEEQARSASNAAQIFLIQHNPMQKRALAQNIQQLRNQNIFHGAARLNGALDVLAFDSTTSKEADTNLQTYLKALETYKQEKQATFDTEQQKILQQHHEALSQVAEHLNTLEEQLLVTYQNAVKAFEETQTHIDTIALTSQAINPSLYEAKAAAEAFYQILQHPRPSYKICIAAFERFKQTLDPLEDMDNIDWVDAIEIPSNHEERKKWPQPDTKEAMLEQLSGFIDAINQKIESEAPDLFAQQSYANIELLDLHSLQNAAAYVVSNRVHHLITGLKAFARQPTTYKYGFLHHGTLIPLAQKLRA